MSGLRSSAVAVCLWLAVWVLIGPACLKVEVDEALEGVCWPGNRWPLPLLSAKRQMGRLFGRAAAFVVACK